MPAQFGYWKVRANGQAIRLLMAYTGDDVDDKQYVFDVEKVLAGAGIEAAAEWYLQDKLSLPVPFPNLPYYMDEKVKLTQSLAIMKYLGRKYNLYGSSIEEAASIDMVAEEMRDYRKRFMELCHDKQFAEKKDDFKKALVEKLPSLEAFLAEKPYFTGSQIMWADFLAYEDLDKHRACWPDIFDGFPKISAFLSRIEALPKIKAYMESDKFIKRPMLGPFATFNT